LLQILIHGNRRILIRCFFQRGFLCTHTPARTKNEKRFSSDS
jgi:hypothetical protein